MVVFFSYSLMQSIYNSFDKTFYLKTYFKGVDTVETASVSRRVPRKASAGVSSVTEALAPRRARKRQEQAAAAAAAALSSTQPGKERLIFLLPTFIFAIVCLKIYVSTDY